MPSMAPSTLRSLQRIMAIYNEGLDASVQLSIETHDFGFAGINNDFRSRHNTKLTARKKRSVNRLDEITIYYNRMDLTGVQCKYALRKGSAERLSDMINTINEGFGLDLGPDDYIDDVLPREGSLVNVAIQSGSYLFMGNLNFNLIA